MPASSVLLRLARLAVCAGVVVCAALAVPRFAQGQVSPNPADAPTPLHELIDAEIQGGWETRGIVGTGLSSDAEFFRRITLDLTGMIPRSAQVRAFLADRQIDKRRRAIDELLASPEHARYQAKALDLMLMERRPAKNIPQAEWDEYLRQAVAQNKPWDLLVQELLLADGTTGEAATKDSQGNVIPRPAARFFLDREGDSHLLTRDVGRLLLGRDLQCAQCHDHPLIADYLQRDYHGMLAFWNRSFVFQPKDQPALAAEKAEGDVSFNSVFVKDDTDQVAAPHLPGDTPINEPQLAEPERYQVAAAEGVRPVPKFSRRAQLAELLPRADTPGFARNLANRLWAQMFGRGLVHPLDLDHGDNLSSHPQLLDRLTAELVTHGFDMRYLIRELALSQSYQRSSQWPLEDQRPAPEAFAVAALRPLGAESLGWSVQQATGITDVHAIALSSGCNESALHERLAGGLGEYLGNFASPAGESATAFQATLAQTLLLSNGGTLQAWLAPQNGNLTHRLLARSKPGELADELYLSVLARRPSSEEAAEVEGWLKDRVLDRSTAISELVWALVTSSEFRFNH